MRFTQTLIVLVSFLAACLSIYQFSLPKPFHIFPEVTFEACQPNMPDTKGLVTQLVALNEQVVYFRDLNVFLLNAEIGKDCTAKLIIKRDELLPIQVQYFIGVDTFYPSEDGALDAVISDFSIKFPTTTEGSYSARYLRITDDSLGVEYKGPMFVSFTDSGGSSELVLTPIDVVGAGLLHEYQCTMELLEADDWGLFNRLRCI